MSQSTNSKSQVSVRGRGILIVLSVLVLIGGAYLTSQNLVNLGLLTENDLGLPGPNVDFAKANALNSYDPASIVYKGALQTLTVVVRTYADFIEKKSTDKLLDSLGTQDVAVDTPISVIMVSTDLESVKSIKDKVDHVWTRARPSLDVFYHDIPESVYEDNCCQIDEICNGAFQKEWLRAGHAYYSSYRSVQLKVDRACAANNLLHYVLTDAALHYVVEKCTTDCHNKYVMATNGDNEYKATFAAKVMQAFSSDPSVDALMVDYLERGERLVRVATEGNSMDLGCMVFRISSLQRLRVGFLTGAQAHTNTWPYHYYGADRALMMMLAHQLKAKIGYIHETLFVHW